LRDRTGGGLILLNLLVIILILVIVFLPSSPPYNAFRIILGLPLVLFIPGYALTAALFPKQEALDSIERLALSFGLSIVSVALIVLILNYTPTGIKLEPVLYSISGFTFAVSLIALWRRTATPFEERFNMNIEPRLPGWEGSALNKCLSILLAVVILASLATAVYVIAVPGEQEAFTEFYIMQPDDAAGYPAEFILDGGVVIQVGYGNDEPVYIDEPSGRVIPGIINNEGEQATYRVGIKIDDEPVYIYVDGEGVDYIESITLADGEKWEQEIGFAPLETGENQKVEFTLYKNGSPDPYKSLHIWTNTEALD